MRNQTPLSRRWEPSLQVPAGGGLVLYVAGAEQSANGALAVRITAWNGVPLHGDTVDPLSADQREAFIAKVVAKHAPTDPSTLDTAMLGLGDQMPRLILEAPGRAGDVDDADGADSGSRKQSQATQLVAIASEAEMFHTPDGEAYATVPTGGHRETWLVRTKGFRRWLCRLFYETTGKAPGSQAVQDALNVLQGRALFDGQLHPVYTRVAEHDGSIYVDLGNEKWETVQIDRGGWRVVDDPPVKFRRPRGMLPLPHPVAGGSLRQLRPLINVKPEDWCLVVAWLVGAARATGPYPVLVTHGDQGSAKSTLERIMRALVDPNAAPLRSESRDERDLVIAASNGHVIGLDNLSRLPGHLSDAICRLATGGGFGTRELYSDSEETLFNNMRPVMLNGIEELATRGDMLDRSIIVYLPTIPEEQRRPEAEVWASFEAAQPAILGALYEAISTALRNLASTHLERLPRMADFALWVTASEPALGLTPGEFLDRYAANRRDANALTLEASPIVPFVQQVANGGGHQDDATALLRRINLMADEDTKRLRGWPRTGSALSNTLRRLPPNLRASGISVELGQREAHTGKRLVIVKSQQGEESRETSSPPSPPSPQSQTGDDVSRAGDDRMVAESAPSSPEVIEIEMAGDDGDTGDDEVQPYSKRGVCVACKGHLDRSEQAAAVQTGVPLHFNCVLPRGRVA